MTSRLLIASLAVLPLLLVGCAGSSNFQGTPAEFVGEPGGDAETGLQAFWLEEGAKIAITISGSSSCPSIVSGITVVDEAGDGNRIAADVPPLPDRPCTMDYVPHTTVFSTPGTVTTTEPLVIEVMDSEIILPIK